MPRSIKENEKYNFVLEKLMNQIFFNEERDEKDELNLGDSNSILKIKNPKSTKTIENVAFINSINNLKIDHNIISVFTKKLEDPYNELAIEQVLKTIKNADEPIAIFTTYPLMKIVVDNFDKIFGKAEIQNFYKNISFENFWNQSATRTGEKIWYRSVWDIKKNYESLDMEFKIMALNALQKNNRSTFELLIRNDEDFFDNALRLIHKSRRINNFLLLEIFQEYLKNSEFLFIHEKYNNDEYKDHLDYIDKKMKIINFRRKKLKNIKEKIQ